MTLLVYHITSVPVKKGRKEERKKERKKERERKVRKNDRKKERENGWATMGLGLVSSLPVSQCASVPI